MQGKIKIQTIMIPNQMICIINLQTTQFYQFKMQKSQCIGCKNSFQQGFKLPLQDLTVELKMYYLPIKDNLHKFIILKTIISFLNSKGGTIFIGAEDKTGEVIGIPIDRKQQDQFKLFIQLLAEKIQPSVDLSNREDIIVQFVPVNKNGIFTGRHLGKIIVKQGQTSKLYCFSQRIQLQTSNDKKYDEFQVVYSFKRMNMGSVKKITGFDVVNESTQRAIKPTQPVNIFHQGCNPQPIYVSSQASIPGDPQGHSSPKQSPKAHKRQDEPQQQQSYTLQFFKVGDSSARQKLEEKLDELLTSIKIKWFIISFEQENDTLLIQFVNKKQWVKSMEFLDSKLDQINESVKGLASFIKKQCEDDYAIYENQRPIHSPYINAEVSQLKEEQIIEKQKKQSTKIPLQKVEQEQQVQMVMEQTPDSVLKKSQSLQEQIKQNQKQKQKDKNQNQNQNQNKNKNPAYEINLTSQRKQKKSLFNSNKFIALPSTVNLEQASVLTITHLNPSKKSELKNYVNGLNESNKKIDEYDKTLEFHFENQNDFDEIYDKLSKSKDLTRFGFRGILRFGINTGQITLQNYDKKKYREFKQYIAKLVGQDAKRCQFTKKGDKYSLLLTLKSVQKAGKWLDKLIQDKDLKTFRVPNNDALKMKIDLVCVKPTKSKNQNSQNKE